MSKTTVVNWDRQRVRFVTAEVTKKNKLRAVEAGTIEIQQEGDRTEQLADALKQVVGGKTDIVVAVTAGAAEVARVCVPKATDAELPLFVRNLAGQELRFTSEEPVLDFLAEPPDEDGSRMVTAMLLREEEITRIRDHIAAADTKMSRLHLIPHGLATYLPENKPLCVAVAVGAGHCEVLVVSNGQPVAMRSLRLPDAGDPEQLGRHCVSEVRRTLLSLNEAVATTDAPDEVVVLGSGLVATEIATGLPAELGTNSTLHNPFDDVDSKQTPEDAGLFAGLLGLAAATPPIDFVNPRRPVPPVSKKRIFAMVAAVLLAVVGGGAYYVWSQFDEIDSENKLLENRVRELNDLVKKSKPKRDLAKALTSWEASRFSWLDEIRDLTERMPSRSDLTIRQLNIRQGSRGSSSISFSGVAKKSDAVARMEVSLRDEHHTIRTPGLREASRGANRAWTFQSTMRVKRRSQKQYAASRATGAQNVAQSGGAAK